MSTHLTLSVVSIGLATFSVSCSIFKASSPDAIKISRSASEPNGFDPSRQLVTLKESVAGRASSDAKDFLPRPLNLSAGTFECKANILPRTRIVRLTRSQVRNVLKDGFGVEPTPLELSAISDSSGLFFDNEAAAQKFGRSEMASWWLSARSLALRMVENGRGLPAKCKADDEACWARYLQAAALSLHRKPISDAEALRLKEIVKSHSGKTEGEIAQAVLRALLTSPHFLYRSELGSPVEGKPGMRRLAGHEAASLLSFTLWQSSPDAELLRAASAGQLETLAGLRQQAERMSKDPRISRFFAELTLQLAEGTHIGTLPLLLELPEGAALAKAYFDEVHGFVNGVLNDPRPTFETFMTKSTLEGVPNGAVLRALPPAGGGTVRLPEGAEAGVLALGVLSLAGSNGTLPSPVRRGKVVAERFLCTTLPPPPEGIDTDVVSAGSSQMTNLSNRELYELATNAQPSCAACHSRFNDLGYAFEAFDHLGRYRTRDAGKEVNASGNTVLLRSGNFAFSDLSGLARGLSNSEQVGECFVLNAFRYSTGRVESVGDGCALTAAKKNWTAKDYDLRTLAVNLVTLEQSLYRSGEQK